MSTRLFASDLDTILLHTLPIWHELKNERVFITGGTGFIGRWLLETLAWANRKLDLGLKVMVLTRNNHTFSQKAPHLACDPTFSFLQGDVRNFVFPNESFNYVIHAATEACAKLNQEQPQQMLDTIIKGTERTLQFATYARVKKFLYLSSGAVYGKQNPQLNQLEEDHEYAHQVKHTSAYAIGKCAAEQMCINYSAESALKIKIARCFAFVGPYLPLAKHFAIGNFIRDGLLKKGIYVHSDGSALRSYQYPSDLVIWLLHILCFGQHQTPYNVGSDKSISILELAHLVAESFTPKQLVHVALPKNTHSLPERYIPSIQRAQRTLGLTIRISLPEAIRKTIDWYKESKA